MKYLLNIFLVFYVVLKPIAPIIDYAVRYDYISQELCVNKNKAELNCNGKCYLAKEIVKNTENNSKTEIPKSTVHIDLFIPKDVLLVVDNNILLLDRKAITNHFPSLYTYSSGNFVFRPPLI